ncbi:MAG: diguanylate cyclase, partial [Thermoleophilaceae bacterium]|nr:diguanylate cyclase [Thermoleophilaceae bacterium]
GDEFAAIVFHRDPSQVEEFAHDCAQAVADCKLPEQFGGAKISITVGTASYSDHVESVAELLMRADSRLMRRKHPVEPVEPTSNPQRRARPADGRSQSSNAFSAEDGVERRADRPGADLRGYASGVDDDGPNMMQSYVGVATWVAAAAVILFSLSLPGADRTYMTEVYWLTGVALVSAGVIFAISLWRFELSAVIGNVSAAIFLAIAIFYTGGSESQVLPVILFNVAFSAYFNPRLQAQLDVLLAIVVVASPLLYESASENQVYFMRFVVLASAAVVIALVVMRNKGELALAEKFSSDLARRDSLTGLDNRRAFHEQMSRELRRLEGDSRAGLALMMVDLDNFKNVNTLYGHAGGDLLLQAVADELRSAAREGDHVARVGGDEFALIARGASQMSVRSLADRCLGAVRTAVEREGFTDCDVSASVGYALAPLHGRTLDELVTAADTAVNHIKSTGKDATGEFDSTPHAI